MDLGSWRVIFPLHISGLFPLSPSVEQEVNMEIYMHKHTHMAGMPIFLVLLKWNRKVVPVPVPLTDGSTDVISSWDSSVLSAVHCWVDSAVCPVAHLVKLLILVSHNGRLQRNIFVSFNCTPVKIYDCIMHCCETEKLPKEVISVTRVVHGITKDLPDIEVLLRENKTS